MVHCCVRGGGGAQPIGVSEAWSGAMDTHTHAHTEAQLHMHIFSANIKETHFWVCVGGASHIGVEWGGG